MRRKLGLVTKSKMFRKNYGRKSVTKKKRFLQENIHKIKLMTGA